MPKKMTGFFTRFGPGFGQDFGQVFGEDLGQDFGQTGQQKQQHSLQQQRGTRAKSARPFIVSVPAVVSVVLFDQNLDQKIDLGWPGSSPGLAQVKPWAGAGSSPWENWANFPKGFPKIPPYEKLGLSFLRRCMLVQHLWLVPLGPR